MREREVGGGGKEGARGKEIGCIKMYKERAVQDQVDMMGSKWQRGLGRRREEGRGVRKGEGVREERTWQGMDL